jgi:glycerol-1-phosphate dehydrogenase [NAD(P)+]
VTAALLDADLILGVGSGVIQDLCKYVSKVTGVPYAVAATAPSMDGYASDGAAMVLGGMQVTVPAGLPIAIVADTAVMADAPADMISAGYGDIVGKYSALADWRLAELVTGEYLCPAVFDATLTIVNRTVAAADGIRKHEKEALAVLCDALIAVGILMSYVNSSRPASGSEHHLSHFFKITGLLAGRDYLPHGIDVAGATVLTTRLREALLAADWHSATPARYDAAYRAALAPVLTAITDDCIALQEKHGRYANADARRATYLEKESEIRAALAEMPSSQEIAEYLVRGGIAPDVLVGFYGDAVVRDAIRYAKELKDRYTVLWVAHDLGIYGDL